MTSLKASKISFHVLNNNNSKKANGTLAGRNQAYAMRFDH